MAKKKYSDMTSDEKKKLFKALAACVVVVIIVVLEIILAVNMLFGQKDNGTILNTEWVRDKDYYTSGETDLSCCTSLSVDSTGRGILKCTNNNGNAYEVVIKCTEKTINIGGTEYNYKITNNKSKNNYLWRLAIEEQGNKVYLYR